MVGNLMPLPNSIRFSKSFVRSGDAMLNYFIYVWAMDMYVQITNVLWTFPALMKMLKLVLQDKTVFYRI